MNKNISIIFDNLYSKNYDICLEILTDLCRDGIDLYVINSSCRQDLNNNIHYINAKNNKIRTINGIIQQCLRKKNNILFVNNRMMLNQDSLDEMLFQLELTEKNGIVCSGGGETNNEKINYDKSKNLRCNQCIVDKHQLLNRFSILPIVESLPVLIKYNTFLICGLLDESFTNLSDAIDEFSLRINQFGYSTVRANYGKCYYFEISDVSVLEKKKINEKTIQNYPYIGLYLPMYLDYGITAREHFSSFLTAKRSKRKLLYSLYELPDFYNGTSQHALFLLDAFYKLFSSKYDISILINKKADDFFGISNEYNNVFYPEDVADDYYDIAYIPGQFFSIQHLFLINRIAIKYVFDVQDIISVRCDYIHGINVIQKVLFQTSLQFCNGFTTLSKFVDEDVRNYYYYKIFCDRAIPSKYVYLTNTIKKTDTGDKKNDIIPFNDYIVAFGNNFKHKNIDNLITTIRDSKYKYVIIGTSTSGFLGENIYGLKSGNISEQDLATVMKYSKAFLFPSVYEGFGLPIFNALIYKKNIVVYNSALNRELIDFIKEDGRHVICFECLNEVEMCLDKILLNKQEFEPKFTREWKDVAVEVETFIWKIANGPIDFQLLELRWHDIIVQEFLYQNAKGIPTVQNIQNDFKLVTLKELIKHYLKVNHPNFFRKLKELKNMWR